VHGIVHGEAMLDSLKGTYEAVDPDYSSVMTVYTHDFIRGNVVLEPSKRVCGMVDFGVG
jgi:Ser/Thr protein kinase RdoA (MazF antagonist)